jgi:hypothetical protein
VNPTASTLLAAAGCDYHRRDYESTNRSANAADELMAEVPTDDRHAADVLIAEVRVVHSRTRNPSTTAHSAARMLDLLDHSPRRQLPTIEHYRVVKPTLDEPGKSVRRAWSVRWARRPPRSSAMIGGH